MYNLRCRYIIDSTGAPEESLVGIVLAALSLIVMPLLVRAKESSSRHKQRCTNGRFQANKALHLLVSHFCLAVCCLMRCSAGGGPTHCRVDYGFFDHYCPTITCL